MEINCIQRVYTILYHTDIQVRICISVLYLSKIRRHWKAVETLHEAQFKYKM